MYNETAIRQKENVVTFPVFCLIVYVIFTFSPVIYTYMPFFGKLRIVMIAGFGLLVSYLMTASSYANLRAWKNSVFYAWCGFLVVMILSLLVSLDRGTTLNVIEVNLRYFIVLAIMIRIIDSAKRLEMIMGVFALCGVVMALSTIIHTFVFKQTFVDSHRAMGVEGGIFGDPNDLAMLLSTTLAILLYFTVKARRKILPVFGVMMLLTAIMLTYSRGGFLGLCVVAVGFLVLNGKKKKTYGVALVASAILFWTLAPVDYKERISTIKEESSINQESGKPVGRLQDWIGILPEGMKRPFLGAGAGCSFYIAGVALSDWHQMHNSFLRVFLEMGLLGMFFFSLLFILPFRQYQRIRRKQERELSEDMVRFGFILLSLAAFATTAFFLPQSYSPILYLLSGMALAQTEIMANSEANSD